MRRLVIIAPVVIAALLAAGSTQSAAAADPGPAVTLQVKPATVDFGQPVKFRGQITPPSGGQLVEVLDSRGAVVAHATSAANGTYAASAKPQHNATVHAQWGAAESHRVQVRVRPRLTAKRSENVLLFGPVTVSGHLAPPLPGRKVDVTLWTRGKPVQRFTPMLNKHGNFLVRFEAVHPGRQTVLVHYEDGEHAGVSWRSKPATPPLPALQSGSSGVFVQLLEKRLMELHYRVYGRDPSFDYRDADSVLAFHKEQRMPLTTSVDQRTWWALANPKLPVIRGPKTGKHFEVDLTKQVLLYVVDGQVDGILHVSTGKPSTPTLPGKFHVWTKQPGTNQEGMYNSSFFDGNRALHGYPDVPSYAASHGCVRIPFWNALWVYHRAPIGIEVLVYNS
jgi:lipoprotein-anchoring transpeptidase ErfK/SrfK